MPNAKVRKNFVLELQYDDFKDLQELCDLTGLTKGYIVRICFDRAYGEVKDQLKSDDIPQDPLKRGVPLKTGIVRSAYTSRKSVEWPPPLAEFIQSGFSEFPHQSQDEAHAYEQPSSGQHQEQGQSESPAPVPSPDADLIVSVPAEQAPQPVRARRRRRG